MEIGGESPEEHKIEDSEEMEHVGAAQKEPEDQTEFEFDRVRDVNKFESLKEGLWGVSEDLQAIVTEALKKFEDSQTQKEAIENAVDKALDELDERV